VKGITGATGSANKGERSVHSDTKSENKTLLASVTPHRDEGERGKYVIIKRNRNYRGKEKRTKVRQWPATEGCSGKKSFARERGLEDTFVGSEKASFS